MGGQLLGRPTFQWHNGVDKVLLVKSSKSHAFLDLS